MKSLAFCRNELAAYNNEQLFMLEQLLRTWHSTKQADERRDLAEQIRLCCHRFTLLEPFYREPERKPKSVEMEKVCQLLTQPKAAGETRAGDDLWQAFFRLLACLQFP